MRILYIILLFGSLLLSQDRSVIFNTGSPDSTEGYIIDPNHSIANRIFVANSYVLEAMVFYMTAEEAIGANNVVVSIREDDNGVPGEEIFSAVQVSGNADGWNIRDMSTEGLYVSGDFWIGMKRFSSSMPIGIDTDSVSGNSVISDDGTTWSDVDGNLMFRVDIDSGLDVADELVPSEFNVSNAYPNPFNPSTTIDLDVHETNLLNVAVYNLKGQLVSTLINETVYPGNYSFVWDGSNVTSGLYIISVSHGDNTYTQKITLVK